MRFRPILLALAFVLLIHGTAFADGGNLLGTAYVEGQPAADICVDVLDNDTLVANQKTNQAGDYNLYVANPGWYTIRFSDCGLGYTSTQISNAEIVSDQDTPGVNAYLSSAGRVAGNVKDDLNAVTTGACVKAEDSGGNALGETTTDGNGNYVLGGLPPGAVNVRFEGCASGNYVAQKQSADVNAGETTSGVDVALTRAGKIAGHVQNAGGDPLGGVCVSGSAGGVELASAVTDWNGNYEIRGVPPTGSYDLNAWDCYGSSGYLQDHATGALAGTGTATADFTLPRAGFITGHVRDDAGAGLASICVTARRQEDGDRAVAFADRNGYYELNGLRPGTWDLTFNATIAEGEESPCTGNGDWVPAATTDVVLGDGETLSDVDKVLAHAPVAPGGGSGSAPTGDGGSGAEASGAGGSGPVGSGAEASGAGGSGPVGSGAHAPGCKVPKLVGLSLANARKALAKAHCRLGRVSRKARGRHGRVLRQRARRGASKPAGFKVALTIAK